MGLGGDGVVVVGCGEALLLETVGFGGVGGVIVVVGGGGCMLVLQLVPHHQGIEHRLD